MRMRLHIERVILDDVGLPADELRQLVAVLHDELGSLRPGDAAARRGDRRAAGPVVTIEASSDPRRFGRGVARAVRDVVAAAVAARGVAR